MPESIRVFENSLREYLVNAQADSFHEALKIQYRYNNLKVYMDPKMLRTPHFWVSVNISSVCFSINPVEKLNGSLASNDRLVALWASKPNINGELRKHWLVLTQQLNNNIANIDFERDVDDKLMDSRRPKTNSLNLQDSIKEQHEKDEVRKSEMEKYYKEHEVSAKQKNKKPRSKKTKKQKNKKA